MHDSHDDRRSDHKLVAAANRGDREAFEAIYLRHRQWAADLAYRFTGEREAALDVMQEAFMYLLGRFPGFELRANLRTYLYPVIRNTALTRQRAEGRRPTEPLSMHDPPAAEASTTSAGPSLDDLATVIDALPAGQREVVLLRFMDDLSLADIAEAMGVPLGTVKSRLHHALSALRRDERTKKYFLD